jgi:hypothetical protein
VVLATGYHPRHSLPGIIWTAVTAVVMFALAAAMAQTCTTIHHWPPASLTKADRQPAVVCERLRTGVNETKTETRPGSVASSANLAIQAAP